MIFPNSEIYMGDLKIVLKKILQEIVEVSNYLYNKGLVPGKSGNISTRIIEDDLEFVAVSSSGSSFKTLMEDDILLVDMEGNLVYPSNKTPTSELYMHLGIYKKRKDINGIVHTHSPVATGFAFAERKLERLEGFGPIDESYIPFVEYHPVGSEELADAVSEGLKNQDIVVLKRHGVVATGKNLDEAALLAEFIEDSAKIQLVKKILSDG